MLDHILSYLPPPLRSEILRLQAGRVNFYRDLSEIRLRVGSPCALVLGGRNVLLLHRCTAQDMAALVSRLCHGSVYAFRDAIAEGYLPFPGGVRVGLCGYARYEGGHLVGISEVHSLVFRIPHEVCDSEETLFREWSAGVRAGMLIYSPPGGGKTTALRALARRIGSGHDPRRVAVIDERGEFGAADFTTASVDVLRGYRRAAGLEIATRTLSPEVLVVDEIGGEEEARAMLGVLKTGVPLIATAHAASYDEVCRRRSLAPFLELGVFDVFVGLFRGEDGFRCETVRTA